MLTTVDILPEMTLNDDYQLIQARVVRMKSDLSGEALAKEVSDVSVCKRIVLYMSVLIPVGIPYESIIYIFYHKKY